MGDPWVVGGLRFAGLLTVSFLLASILVLVHSGMWVRRAGGVDAAPVEQLWTRDSAADERLEAAEGALRDLLELIDEETRPTPDGS